ncbi:hypothetical protein [Synechococcus sp. CCFWC 502]|uniref:hypothetical protein n=1 Tax=Synechococcus sp. CCFWC 502 TaxID=2978474 RepID=UPI00260E8AFD|nr:hypothetical protein [Synechococcus sp. CCFWC 502]WFN57726.1 hypothetical protein N4320_07560 [Synechococcus sp. CCFWC 502]
MVALFNLCNLLFAMPDDPSLQSLMVSLGSATAHYTISWDQTVLELEAFQSQERTEDRGFSLICSRVYVGALQGS